MFRSAVFHFRAIGVSWQMNRGLSWGLRAGAVLEGPTVMPGSWGRRQIWQLCRTQGGSIHWSRELPGPEGELRNIWPLSGRVGGRAQGQSWPPPPAGGRCLGGLRVVRRCVQLEGTLRQDEDWGLLGVRA